MFGILSIQQLKVSKKKGSSMAISVEQKVGLFFLATLVLLAVMIEFVEDWRPFEDQYAYFARFNSSVGLKVGDPVRIAGVNAGKVNKIGIEKNSVRVEFEVARFYADKIHHRLEERRYP